eukprot:1192710-Prorocentrum_minimum.AAC.1
MYFLSSTARGGGPLEFDFIGRLEDWEADWGRFVDLMGPEVRILLVNDWSIVRIYPRFLRLIGPS